MALYLSILTCPLTQKPFGFKVWAMHTPTYFVQKLNLFCLEECGQKGLNSILSKKKKKD